MPGDLLPLIFLLLLFLAGLALVPLGLPGLWVMVLGAIGYGWWTDFRTIGAVTIAIAVALALVGELLEAWLGFRIAKRYGSTRAAWGAVIGGLVGAVIGVPVPVIGSVIGAFLGAFAGAALFEWWRTKALYGAVTAGWGALLGRAAAVAVKTGLGLVIAVVTLFALASA
jgi:uncharacterized protein YqgC (DUF456 family)